LVLEEVQKGIGCPGIFSGCGMVGAKKVCLDMIDFEKRINNLLEAKPIPLDEIRETILQMAHNRTNKNLEIIIELAKMEDYYNLRISDPAFAAILSWGEPGINAIIEQPFLQRKMWHFGRTINALLTIAIGSKFGDRDFLNVPSEWLDKLPIEIDKNLSDYAITSLKEIVSRAKFDQDLAYNLFATLGTRMNFIAALNQDPDDKLNLLLQLILERDLPINSTLLEEFSSLLDSSPEREEELHSFLVLNPILIDPLANEIRSKHELGDDFITDFIIRRLGNDYILVEIERSDQSLFNKNGDFSRALTHAIRQVLDFQTWIADHHEYANSKLPGIARPKGLVIIGRKDTSDKVMKRRLDEENFSRRGHIEIVTYDDLLETAETLYNNLKNRPIVFKGKRKI